MLLITLGLGNYLVHNAGREGTVGCYYTSPQSFIEFLLAGLLS